MQPNVHAQQERLQHLCNNVLNGCMPLYVAGLQSQVVSLQVTGHAQRNPVQLSQSKSSCSANVPLCLTLALLQHLCDHVLNGCMHVGGWAAEPGCQLAAYWSCLVGAAAASVQQCAKWLHACR